MASNNGALLEDKFRLILKTLQAKTKAFGHRFPDTKMARSGIIPPQPGDFMLLVPGKAILIECKSTNANSGLLSMAHKGVVGVRQVAHHRLWHRSGNPSLYLWMNIKRDIIEWHDGANVAAKIDKPLFIGPCNEMLESLKVIIGGMK
jgi:hypothetical protein